MPHEHYTYDFTHTDTPTVTCLSPNALRRMSMEMLRLARLMENLQERQMPYTVDGGLLMSTSKRGDLNETTFSIHGTLDIHVPHPFPEVTHG